MQGLVQLQYPVRSHHLCVASFHECSFNQFFFFEIGRAISTVAKSSRSCFGLWHSSYCCWGNRRRPWLCCRIGTWCSGCLLRNKVFFWSLVFFIWGYIKMDPFSLYSASVILTPIYQNGSFIFVLCIGYAHITVHLYILRGKR